MLKIQLCITGINYISTYITIKNTFHNVTVFTVFLSSKCSLGEQKRLKKHNLTNYVKLLNNHQNQAAIVSAAPVVTNVFARSRCL